MRKIRIIALLVLLAFVFAFAATPAKSSDENLPVLYLSGTPRDMGLKQGLLLSESIKENLNLFWEAVVSQNLSKEELLAQTIEREQFLRSEEAEEIRAMAEAAGVNYLELVAFNTFGENFMGGECTSGIAAGTGTLTGQAIGHKNRDASGTQVLCIFEPRPGYRYRYAGVKYSGHIGISHGINELGLGEGNLLLTGPADWDPGVDNLMVNRIIIENSSSVDEAIAYLNQEIREDPSCFFVVDTDKAAYIEWVPSNPVYPEPGVVVNIVENGVAAHTNHYIYEPLKTRWPVSSTSSTVVRYNRMNALMTTNAGQITVKLMISFSRDRAGPYYIDSTGTISAAIMTPDKTYPTWLSTMWTAMYRPGHCIYVPLHNAILQQPTLALTLLAPWNGTAYTRGYNLYLRYGHGAYWAPLKTRFVQVEDDIMANNAFNEALVTNALQKGASLEDCTRHLTIQDSWTANRVLRVEEFMYTYYPNPPVTSLYIPPPGPARARLTVQADPPDVCAPILGEGWYDLSTDVSLEAPAGPFTIYDYQYFFLEWLVDDTSKGRGVNPITVHMDANYTATARYVTPQTLDFSWTGPATVTKGSTATYTASYTITANVDLTDVKVQGGIGAQAMNIKIYFDEVHVDTLSSLQSETWSLGNGITLELDVSKRNNVFVLTTASMAEGESHTLSITFDWAFTSTGTQDITGAWSAVCTSMFGTLKTPYTDVITVVVTKPN